ncbi:helix-turn-helix transcriptional regulator [Desulfonema magnum]|uniref:HTH domain-containing protein, Cro/C1-type n=1 Tax=Desulfonema magnum TaxID=45655 RepID=A0A975GK66_9BACT|nr:helix-turn-helix transcriptional regulator [Desulfonema magnum]QTA84419.1 HTH domain-containing protein, Cro/C1-type [Desulfonema magnum]
MKKIFPNGNIMNDIKEIGYIIRKKRREYGLTQVEAAGLCNVGVRFMSELENGKPTLQVGKVLHVLEAYGFSVTITHREDL